MISAWGVDDGVVTKAKFPRIGASSAGQGLSPHSPFYTDAIMASHAPRKYSQQLRQEGMRSAKGKHAQRVGSFFPRRTVHKAAFKPINAHEIAALHEHAHKVPQWHELTPAGRRMLGMTTAKPKAAKPKAARWKSDAGEMKRDYS